METNFNTIQSMLKNAMVELPKFSMEMEATTGGDLELFTQIIEEDLRDTFIPGMKELTRWINSDLFEHNFPLSIYIKMDDYDNVDQFVIYSNFDNNTKINTFEEKGEYFLEVEVKENEKISLWNKGKLIKQVQKIKIPINSIDVLEASI